MPVPSLVPLDSHLIKKNAGAAGDEGKGVDRGDKSMSLRMFSAGAGLGRGAGSVTFTITHNLQQNPTLSTKSQYFKTKMAIIYSQTIETNSFPPINEQNFRNIKILS